MTDERNVGDVLADRPELESALESIRAVDDAQDTWTFDDLSIDSGTFGQIVSEGLVEKTDDGEYRLPEETRRALDGEEATVTSERPRVSLPTVEIDPRVAGAVAGALVVVALFRIVFSYGAVFQGEHIVLSGNDPYGYRFLLDELVAQTGGEFEMSLLSDMPGKASDGEPLLMATLYTFSTLLGGTVTVSGQLLAWYPVVAAVITGLVVYLLAVTLTDDRRIGLASVVFLATIPAHAMRTSLGYGDHHAFQYIWLAVVPLSLVVLVREDVSSLRDRRPWLLGGGVGLALTAQIISWDNSMILAVPIALYVALAPISDIEAGRSPIIEHAPLVGGLAVATVLIQLVHTQLHWHTPLVAFASIGLLAGATGVLVAGEAIRRLDLPATLLLGVEGVGAVGGLLVFPRLFPAFWSDIQFKLNRFFGTRKIVETRALITGDLTWFFLLGLVVFVAVPPLIWASKRAADGSRPWLVASVYTWYTMVLGAFQIRFVGEMGVFLGLFGGFGFVWLASWVDLTATPKPLADTTPETGLSVPAPKTAGLVLALFLLVGGVGMVQIPVKTDQLTVDQDAYEAAAWTSEYRADQTIPPSESYVLSQWGRNRMFNYIVNGEWNRFDYARRNYPDLIRTGNEEEWYSASRHRRVAFLVTQPFDSPPKSLHNRLHTSLGSQTDNIAGLAHFRALYAPSKEYRVFRVVPGATITGTGPPDTVTRLSKRVEIHGKTFSYHRVVKTNATGGYTVTVPYSGEYTLWNQVATVPEQAVTAGETVTARNATTR